ncbi:MAG: ATP-binding cassette domain-containing protein [Firmicutes bacterium]|nr:ATP-binding cassette domain-containing protein [Bacillota bacterium]
MAQIVVENLVKTFKVAIRQAGLWQAFRGLAKRDHVLVPALDGISFTIEEGELVGYLGPNGAGKSTTVKILSGILVPDSGLCQVMGRVPWQERIAHVREIGVVFGQRSQLWWDLPVIDSFELLRDIYRLSPGDYRQAKEELVEILQLEPLLETPVRQLSLGQRMRCELAASLLHRPKLLFLDEPTIGLDAVSKLVVRDFVKKINRERGTTVILTTHDMDDVEALCSRVMIIGRGKILLQGNLKDIRHQVTRERRLIVELGQAYPEEYIAANVQGAQLVRLEGNQAHFNFIPGQITPSELITEVSKKLSVRDLLIEDPPIDEVISRLYEELHIT